MLQPVYNARVNELTAIRKGDVVIKQIDEIFYFDDVPLY